MQNKFYSTELSSYNEAKALQQLLNATLDAAEFQNDANDRELADKECNDWTDLEFTITVNGIQTAFMLGGPQQEALYAFINHIANENAYEVDIPGRTVKGW